MRDDLLNVKTPLALRIGLFLLENVGATEVQVNEQFKKNPKILKRAAYILRDADIIDIVRMKENNLVYYLIKKKYFDIEDTCRGCKFLETKRIELDDYYKCMKKGKLCYHKHGLIGYAINRHVLKNSIPVNNETYERKVTDRKKLPTDEWVDTDFCYFYIDEFKQSYPELIAPSKHEIKPQVRELISIFKGADKKTWRRLIKHYIENTMFRYREQKKVFSQFAMLEKPLISEFLKTLGKKIKQVQFCNHHDIYCRFFESGKCKLPGGLENCSEVFRKKMIRKYN